MNSSSNDSFYWSLGVVFLAAIGWTCLVLLFAFAGFYFVIGKSSDSIISALIISLLLTFPIIIMELIAEYIISKFTIITSWEEKRIIALRVGVAIYMAIIFLFWSFVLADFQRNNEDQMLAPLKYLFGSFDLTLQWALFWTISFALISRFLTWIPVRKHNVSFSDPTSKRIGQPPSVDGGIK